LRRFRADLAEQIVVRTALASEVVQHEFGSVAKADILEKPRNILYNLRRGRGIIIALAKSSMYCY
jgi:hypothetical protein